MMRRQPIWCVHGLRRMGLEFGHITVVETRCDYGRTGGETGNHGRLPNCPAHGTVIVRVVLSVV